MSTNFDVIALLFGGGGGAASGSRAGMAPPAPEPLPRVSRHATLEELLEAPAVAARAMAALMLADGVIRPGERQFLDGFLREAGLPPLEEVDIRPWRPTDLAIPDDPEPIVEAMLHLMYADRQRDGSEWRVVREYARHWGVSLDRVEALAEELDRRHARPARRLWKVLTGLIVSR